MNREIKFRGKSINSGEWVYAILHGFGMDLFNECVNEDTIGQFTGLHDKNGKEAYENDLVLVNGQMYEVIYVKGMFAIEIKGCGYVPLKNVIFEIIGNIYDNKDVLEE